MVKCHNLVEFDRLMFTTNLSDSDPTLKDVQGVVLQPEWDRIADDQEFEDKLNAYVACPGPKGVKKTLDIVAHTVDVTCLIKPGKWLIELKPDPVKTPAELRFLNLKQQIETLKIVQLRLLGCLSATTNAGWDTLKKLQADFPKVEVSGTNDFLYASDFDENGFSPLSIGKLTKASDLPATFAETDLPDLPDAPVVEGLDLSSFTGVRKEDLVALGKIDQGFVTRRLIDKQLDQAQTDELTKAVERNGRDLPGLLALPGRQYAIKNSTQPDRYVLVDLLFGHRILRAYGKDASANVACFKLKPVSTAPLADMLDKLSGGAPFPSS